MLRKLITIQLLLELPCHDITSVTTLCLSVLPFYQIFQLGVKNRLRLIEESTFFVKKSKTRLYFLINMNRIIDFHVPEYSKRKR